MPQKVFIAYFTFDVCALAVSAQVQMAQTGEAERAETLGQAAENYKSEGRWQYAVDGFRRLLQPPALATYVKPGALLSQAQLYLDQRQFELTRASYKQPLKLAKNLKDHNSQTQALSGQAYVYARQGKRHRTLPSLARAKTLGGTQKVQADAFPLPAHIDYTRNDYEQAHQAEALTFSRRGDKEFEQTGKPVPGNARQQVEPLLPEPR